MDAWLQQQGVQNLHACMEATCERLLAKGKSKMAVLEAAMHQLLRQVFGVLKSQKPLDPNFLAPHSCL
ncbi:MAG: hypothetical protein VKJ46_02890 [Leptolyngbyaceae bacterium]|nr:hypothetical protein [Leptolyngbyaceae bacterium]